MLDLSSFKRYCAVVDNGIARSDLLTANEEEFLESLHSKFKQYKRNTYLSEKQTDWLDSIETKLQNEMGSTYED